MSSQEPVEDQTDPLATRVELSFPSDIGTHGRTRIHSEYYKKYLTKVHDTATVGDEWDEFTDVGCCGSKMDLPFIVESVEGGSRVDLDTEIVYTEREACGVNPGWSVQHDEPDALDGH